MFLFRINRDPPVLFHKLPNHCRVLFFSAVSSTHLPLSPTCNTHSQITRTPTSRQKNLVYSPLMCSETSNLHSYKVHLLFFIDTQQNSCPQHVTIACTIALDAQILVRKVRVAWVITRRVVLLRLFLGRAAESGAACATQVAVSLLLGSCHKFPKGNPRRGGAFCQIKTIFNFQKPVWYEMCCKTIA